MVIKIFEANLLIYFCFGSVSFVVMMTVAGLKLSLDTNISLTKKTQEAGARPAPETTERHFRRHPSAQLAWNSTICAVHRMSVIVNVIFINLMFSFYVSNRVFATVYC